MIFQTTNQAFFQRPIEHDISIEYSCSNTSFFPFVVEMKCYGLKLCFWGRKRLPPLTINCQRQCDIDTDTHICCILSSSSIFIPCKGNFVCGTVDYGYFMEKMCYRYPDRPKHRCVKKNVLKCRSMCKTHVH